MNDGNSGVDFLVGVFAGALVMALIIIIILTSITAADATTPKGALIAACEKVGTATLAETELVCKFKEATNEECK